MTNAQSWIFVGGYALLLILIIVGLNAWFGRRR